MRLLEVDGAPLAVYEWRPADGPPLVFWHSLRQSRAALGEVGARLAAAGFHVVAPAWLRPRA